jgi:hypothetical protein
LFVPLLPEGGHVARVEVRERSVYKEGLGKCGGIWIARPGVQKAVTPRGVEHADRVLKRAGAPDSRAIGTWSGDP